MEWGLIYRQLLIKVIYFEMKHHSVGLQTKGYWGQIWQLEEKKKNKKTNSSFDGHAEMSADRTQIISL